MKTIIFILGGICFQLNLFAQQVTVLHTFGTVQYFTPNKLTPSRVYPGMRLQTAGKIKSVKGGSAKLLYKGSTFVIKSSRPLLVAEVVKAAKPASQMSFTGRFWNFITESVEEGESSERLQQHHKEYLNKNSAAIKGYASKDFTIGTSMLTVGKLPNATVTFKWRNVPGTGPYTFALMEANGNVVANLHARDTVITLDLDQLQMDIQGDYYWNVHRNNKNDCSINIPFKLIDANYSKQIETLSKYAEYQSANPVEQKLMLAYLLEQENANFQANELYNDLLKLEPENRLVKVIYSTFLARMDLMNEANTNLPKN